MKGRVDARTRVGASVERAFAAFTTEIDAWWKRGPRFRFGDGREGRLQLEPGVGGRLVERFDDGEVLVVARVEAWEPPTRFVLAWSPAGGEPSEVEVRFDAVEGGTEVHLQHRGLDRRAGDPVTGLRGTARRNVLAVWWGDLLGGFSAAS